MTHSVFDRTILSYFDVCVHVHHSIHVKNTHTQAHRNIQPTCLHDMLLLGIEQFLGASTEWVSLPKKNTRTQHNSDRDIYNNENVNTVSYCEIQHCIEHFYTGTAHYTQHLYIYKFYFNFFPFFHRLLFLSFPFRSVVGPNHTCCACVWMCIYIFHYFHLLFWRRVAFATMWHVDCWNNCRDVISKFVMTWLYLALLLIYACYLFRSLFFFFSLFFCFQNKSN